jgi:hypothetical protein
MADNSKTAVAVEAPKLNETQQRIEDAKDKANWEWVTVPEHSVFGTTHAGIQHNFKEYGPGRHFVDPLTAEQLRTNIDNGMRGEMRIMQPQTDPRYNEIMKKMGRTPATNPNF